MSDDPDAYRAGFAAGRRHERERIARFLVLFRGLALLLRGLAPADVKARIDAALDMIGGMQKELPDAVQKVLRD